MSFFKVNRSVDNPDISRPVERPEKVKYIIDKDGKGHWIKPKPPMANDYDEDIIY